VDVERPRAAFRGQDRQRLAAVAIQGEGPRVPIDGAPDVLDRPEQRVATAQPCPESAPGELEPRSGELGRARVPNVGAAKWKQLGQAP